MYVVCICMLSHRHACLYFQEGVAIANSPYEVFSQSITISVDAKSSICQFDLFTSFSNSVIF